MNRHVAFSLVAVAALAVAGGVLWFWLHFFPARTSISIFFGGPGAGSVTAPGLISCSSDCTAGDFYEGFKITLTATPMADSLFAGWAGDVCQGTQPTCMVTLAQSNRVIVYFRSQFKTVAAGAYHTCVLRPGGDIWCWGKNKDGQLGSGTQNDSQAPGPVLFITNAVEIAAGGYHTCALLVDGTVQCWGNNSYGQVLPSGFLEPVSTGRTVIGLFPEVLALAAGGYHTCAVHPGGTASCWGLNANGQLGDGTTNTPTTRPVAVQLGGVGPLTSTIAAGGFHTCAILAAVSSVTCWGMNNDGQLGRGSTPGDTKTAGALVQIGQIGCTPGFIEGCADLANGDITLLKAKAIAASIGVGQDPTGVFGGFHTVALDTTGFDWGWGNNDTGQVSPNISGGQSFAVPGVIFSPPTIFPTKIAAGAYHTCMSSRIDGVFCRGHNRNGESGPTPNTSNKTDAVPMTTGAVDLAAGGYHTCAVVSGITMDPAGSVVCWGENWDGQVTGMRSSDVTFPTLLTAP